MEEQYITWTKLLNADHTKSHVWKNEMIKIQKKHLNSLCLSTGNKTPNGKVSRTNNYSHIGSENGFVEG